MNVVLTLHKENNERAQSMTGSPDNGTDCGGGFTFTITGEDGNQPLIKLLRQMVSPMENQRQLAD